MKSQSPEQHFWLQWAWVFMDKDLYLYRFFLRMGGISENQTGTEASGAATVKKARPRGPGGHYA